MSFVTDPNLQINKADNVKVDFYSELMSNYFPESSIEAGEDIQSLMVAPERPMLFCLDKDGKLQGILRTEGSESGWVKLSLSKGKVASFEIEYDSEEQSFRIAKVEDNKVWISREMKLARTNFEKLERRIKWESWSPETPGEIINKVSLGTEHALYATRETEKDALYYLIDLQEDTQAHYTLPENAKEIRQFELGNFQNTNGLFLLYDMAGKTHMLYQSFPIPQFPKQTTKARLKSGEPMNCFTLLEGDNGMDMLYVAGEKVYEFVGHADGRGFNLNEVPTVPGGEVRKIKAAGHGDERSIWSLNDKGLYYCTNRFFNQETSTFETGPWTEPLVMAKNADQFSCLKGPNVQNQVFSLSTRFGSELTRLWQDSVTTLWNSHKLTVHAADSLKEVQSYSAHIRFSSKTRLRTFHGLKARLKAESNLFVYIDSKSYHIGPDHEIEVELGIVPEFTVICPVRDIASSRLIVSADFLDGDIAINLTDKVLERLEEKAPSGDALADARLPDGSHLVAEGTDPDMLAEAAKGIQGLVSAAKDLRTESTTNFKRAEFSAVGGSVGIAANTPLSQGGHTLGDFLHAAWDGVKKAFSFVVEKIKEGFKFVIKIGEQIFNWIVKTLHEIGSFIQKVFEAIAVAFKDLFEFLAFLFDWQSIIDTKEAFKEYANAAIDSLRDGVEDIRTFINRELSKAIDNFSPELNNLPSGISKLDVGDGSDDNANADPRSNWLNSKKDAIQNSKEGKIISMPTEFTDIFSRFISDAQPIFAQLGEGFLQQVSLIGDAFQKVIDGSMTFGDFLKMLAQKLAGFALFLVKQLIDLLLTSLKALIEVAKAGLNQEWKIPILSSIYRDISGSELTFLDVTCLFIAIPTNIMYKIGEGKAPFGDDKTREEFVKAGRQVFQLNIA